MATAGNDGAALSRIQSWFDSRFCGKDASVSVAPGIYVSANHDPVLADKRQQTPLKIGDKLYRKGLYCHANSHLEVRLPSAARSFYAEVGLDHNVDTARGKGSVVFSVEAGGKKLFESGVLRYGSPAEKVQIDLGGVQEFALKIGDAGDGIGWDQSDWADAHVVLASGQKLYLSDLKIYPRRPPSPWPKTPPFSLKIGGAPFVPTEWNRDIRNLGRNQTQVTLRASQGGLEVACITVLYRDLPFAEWTCHLKNIGEGDTPLITDFHAIDTDLDGFVQAPATLHHHLGSPCQLNDFEPYQTPIEKPLAFNPGNGRPSDAVLPYFNIEGAGNGITLGIGWPGQWACVFEPDGSSVRAVAGQETTRFVLHPGESVRSPLIAIGAYDGSWIDGQNLWRRWMVAHNIPKINGTVIPPQHAACSSHQLNEMLNANEANQKAFIDGYRKQGIKPDYWWMDAGWYPNNGGWWYTGTWEVDSSRFPNGLRAISDHAHAQGIKTIVWFEPERVHPGTWLFTEKPQWLLRSKADPNACALLDLGNQDARSWLTEHVSGLIDRQGIDFYRQDFNINPLSYWREADEPNRQGITENRYVQGYLAYWDALKSRHPSMPIDTCASGGRRLDLETLRRSVPLLRSDFILNPTANQCHTYGLSFWLPYQGTGENTDSLYRLRSIYVSAINTVLETREDKLNFKTVRNALAERKAMVDCLMGDYYPLMPYTTAEDQWIAWQFNLPEQGKGVIQAFRRPLSAYESVRLHPKGLKSKAIYEISGNGSTFRMSGAKLMKDGLLVTLGQKPDSAVILYRTVK